MNRLEISINFISYLHSGRGYVTLSFKNSTPRKEILDFFEGHRRRGRGEGKLEDASR